MLCEKMKNIVNHIKTKFNNDLRKYNLTASQFVVLKYLFKNKNKNTIQKDLCDYLVLKHTTVLGIISRLEQKGLIKRDGTSYIKITEKGEKLFNDIGDYEQYIEQIVFGKINHKDKEYFSKMLDLIEKEINAMF